MLNRAPDALDTEPGNLNQHNGTGKAIGLVLVSDDFYVDLWVGYVTFFDETDGCCPSIGKSGKPGA